MSVPVPLVAVEDDEHMEHDSAFVDDLSSTTTLKSEHEDYVLENGRRYHAAIEGYDYWGPNDDAQNEQLDMFHHLCLILLDQKLFLAPIQPNPQEVLDLGTGTGIWAMDFADAHPSAKVTGTDISPVQPQLVAPNLQFVMDDINEPWLYRYDSCDLIHLRALSGCVQDWLGLYQNIFSSLKPGGWINQLEVSNQFCLNARPLPDDHILSTWSSTLIKAGERNGKTMQIAELATGHIKNAGFLNVVQKIYKVPLGNWPTGKRRKELGLWNFVQFDTGMEGFALRLLTQVMGWENTEVQALLGSVRQAIRHRDTQAYLNIYVVYAQKPDEVVTWLQELQGL